MMNPLSKIIAILISIILMFIAPLLYMAQKQDAISQNYVSYKTTEFIDVVKNCGYISVEMYMDYVKKIDDTNNLYTIELVHSKKIVEPLYDEDSGDFLDDYHVYYYNYYQEDILEMLDEGKEYKLFQGDYISISVVNKTKTMATRLMELFFPKMEVEQILVTYGGVIRDEMD